VNTSGHALPDVGVWVPFAEVRLAQPVGSGAHAQITHEALTWDNSKNGWFTPNFIDASGNATGESLLVTAQLLTGSSQTTLAAGDVANASGHEQYPLSSTDFLKGGQVGTWAPEIINTNDLLPFSDIGSLAAGQSKSFDIAVTAHWGGADLGPVRVGGWFTTLAPDTGSSSGGSTTYHGLVMDG
jgi:hypothetical protein